MKNKILSLVLALLMAASSASAVLADDVVAIAEEEAVVEVAEEVEAGQYDKAIEFLANYGIFKGYDKNNTGAEDLIQRYQMALFVARIATGWTEDEVWEDGPENWSEFSDIDFAPVNSYYGALSFANQKGIIEGYGNGKFGPTDSITYQNALTMVVRTLGYTGLDWPWGYIQKAVELGLTDGITGVAYTDELTRGEVAQIVYNALFAKTKDGSNLGLKNFGIEFGWEKVVITASDRNSFTKLASDKGTGVGSKFVEFKLLNDDGSLADDAYLALAADFDLDVAKHEDDLAVGNAYYALFEKDADSELAKIVAVESLLVDVIENEGKTDDEGDAQEYAIQEFLADYTLVDKYTTNEYLNVTKSGKNELLVWNAVDGITEDVVKDHAIAIDWNTGDILGYEYDKDGKVINQNGDKDKDGKDIINKEDYVVQWYYNKLLGRYYEEQYDKKTGEFLGINYMTDEEFEKFYESTAIKASESFKGFNAITEIAKTAYATLEVFDTNLDGVADRALYESYKLGYFENSTIKHCDADRASYKISNVGTLANAEVAGKAAEKAVDTTTFHEIVEGACDHGKAFFVEGYTPVEKYDEDGEFAGYAAGYVIYNADAETGAIKVVKNINDGSDEDTYVATGVLRAYNVAKETITIGDDELTMNYDELAGTGFYYVDKNAATKAAYTGLLRNLFNQFVTYVVVDGELVHIAAKDATKSEVIVVDSYAGIAKDGAIVVYGYSTSDLEYAEFRIANYNNWYGGDYYYYLTDAKAEASFTKGAIYAISSYDAEEDLYYVQLAGSFDEEGNYEVNSEFVNSYYVEITANADGYTEFATADKEHETGVVKMSKDDKYVIITKEAEKNPYAPVIVYTGKLADGWTVKGDRINSDDKDNRTYVIVNATVTGFADTYKTGLALYLKTLNAGFISAGADENLLGAYTTEVYAFDVLNGAEKLYTATNKSFKNGTVYFTQDDVLVEENGVQTMEDLIKNAQEIYGNDTAATTAYGFGYKAVTSKDLFDKDNNKDEQFVFDAIDGKAFFGVSKFYTDLIDDVTIFTVKYDDDKDVITEVKKIDKDGFKKLIADASAYNYPAYVVYNTETTDAVVYIDLVYASGITVTDKDVDNTNNVKVAGTADAYVEANVGFKATTVDGDVAEAVIDGIYLTVDGLLVKDATHANVLANNWYFGLEGDCVNENTKITITVDGEAVLPVYSCIVEETYGDVSKCDVADGNCDLIKSVYIPVVASKIVDGKEVGDVVKVADVDEPVEIVVTMNDVSYTLYFDLYSDMPEDFVIDNGFVADFEPEVIYAAAVNPAN